MKKLMLPIIISSLIIIFCSCTAQPETEQINLQESKMEAICELAVMECYFHNVAKYTEEDAEGMWWWEKDKKFWIEYSGIVSIGIDSSLLSLTVNEDKVTITLPKAKVLSSKVDEATLSEDSFYIEKDSAKIDAEDQTIAFSEAQAKMVDTATADDALLAEAQKRTQVLLSDYVENIGELTGVTYYIEWELLD